MQALSTGAAGRGAGSSPRPEREHWHSLGLQQRRTLVVLTIQVLAAAGTFIAAMIGLWSVSPIISYRIEQQEQQARRAQEEAAAAAETVVMLPDTHPVTAAFVEDVFGWWTAQVARRPRRGRGGGRQRARDVADPVHPVPDQPCGLRGART